MTFLLIFLHFVYNSGIMYLKKRDKKEAIMMSAKLLTVVSQREQVSIRINSIIYCCALGRTIEIHTCDGRVIPTRCILSNIEKELGSEFVRIHRGCIVSARAIHRIDDMIRLSDGESLPYSIRKKKQIQQDFNNAISGMIDAAYDETVPTTYEEYREHYISFEKMPFAFTDIEMVLDKRSHVTDWIFRYGNPQLAELEGVELENLIGRSFNSIFSNADSKWYRAYEQAALMGESLEFVEYSPEIGKTINVICFPSFELHCCCILMDMSEFKYTQLTEHSDLIVKKALENGMRL